MDFVTSLPPEGVSNTTKLVGIFGISATVFLVASLFFGPDPYPNVNLVGEPEGRRWFSLKTRWRYYTDCASLYDEAYNKVSLESR